MRLYLAGDVVFECRVRSFNGVLLESAVLLYSENAPETLRAAVAAAGK